MVAVARFDVSAAAVTVKLYVPTVMGSVHVTSLPDRVKLPGTSDAVGKFMSVFCAVTVSFTDCPALTRAVAGEMLIATTVAGTETVTRAVARFDVSAAAVTVNSYVPATDGSVHVTVLPDLVKLPATSDAEG